MNTAHLHLMVNHVPLFALIFGGLALATGVILRQKVLTQAGLVLAVVAALAAFVAVQTGSGAEEVVENMPGVAEATIHEHEESAEAALWTTVLLGVLAVGALAIPARLARAKQAATAGAVVLTLVGFAMVARTASLGGHIRHPEITSTSSVGTGGMDAGEDEERER